MADIIEITLEVEGVDIDDAGGLLADHLGEIVRCEQESETSGRLVFYCNENSDSAVRLAQSTIKELYGFFPTITIGAPSFAEIEDSDWSIKWKESWDKPLRVGDRLEIVPEWLTDSQVPEGRIRLLIDPGMAFGTGHHNATSLCLRLIEKYDGGKMLDIGCGSGILGIGYAKLFEDEVLLIDNDEAVIDIAQKNVAINRLDERCTVRHATADRVEGKYSVIVANIFLAPLIALIKDIDRLLEKDVVAIFSGITEEQAEELSHAYSSAGFVEKDRIVENGWVGLVFKKGR